MAIIIRGKTRCNLCGAVIKDGDKVSSFPPFISNELDPLSVFNDGGFHSDCFHNHPLAVKAEERLEEILEQNGPTKRICVVCSKLITNPDDYFMVGHLTENPAAPLYAYNYTQAHSSCLPKWISLRHVFELLNDLYLSGTWRGDWLKTVLAQLRYAIDHSEDL